MSKRLDEDDEPDDLGGDIARIKARLEAVILGTDDGRHLFEDYEEETDKDGHTHTHLSTTNTTYQAACRLADQLYLRQDDGSYQLNPDLAPHCDADSILHDFLFLLAISPFRGDATPLPHPCSASSLDAEACIPPQNGFCLNPDLIAEDRTEFATAAKATITEAKERSAGRFRTDAQTFLINYKSMTDRYGLDAFFDKSAYLSLRYAQPEKRKIPTHFKHLLEDFAEFVGTTFAEVPSYGDAYNVMQRSMQAIFIYWLLRWMHHPSTSSCTSTFTLPYSREKNDHLLGITAQIIPMVRTEPAPAPVRKPTAEPEPAPAPVRKPTAEPVPAPAPVRKPTAEPEPAPAPVRKPAAEPVPIQTHEEEDGDDDEEEEDQHIITAREALAAHRAPRLATRAGTEKHTSITRIGEELTADNAAATLNTLQDNEADYAHHCNRVVDALVIAISWIIPFIGFAVTIMACRGVGWFGRETQATQVTKTAATALQAYLGALQQTTTANRARQRKRKVTQETITPVSAVSCTRQAKAPGSDTTTRERAQTAR